MRSKFKWIFTLLVAFTMQFSFAQQKTVTGTVTSDGAKLPGATVSISGTQQGTQTDENGKFSIKASQGDVLEVSFLNKETKTVTVGAGNVINVTLSTKDNVIEAVTVSGALGIKRKKAAVTSSYSTVSNEELKAANNPDAVRALIGKVSGVTINATNNNINGSNSIRVRSMLSISGNTEALVVIDDVISNADVFASIPADVISNVTILKGAQGAALYGSQGKSGVVIVTTKKSNTNGKVSVTLNSVLDIENINFVPKRQTQYGQGWYGAYDPQENGGWGPLFDGVVRQVGLPDANGNIIEAPYSSLGDDTIKDFYKTGYIYQNNLNVNAGGKDSYLNLNLGNLKRDFILEGDTFNRNSVVLNAGKKINKFSLGGTVTFTNQRTKQANVNAATSRGDYTLLTNLLQAASNIPISLFKDRGIYGWNGYYMNPFWAKDNNRLEEVSNFVNFGLNTSYEINKHISLSHNGSIQMRNTNQTSYSNELANSGDFSDGGFDQASTYYQSVFGSTYYYGDFLANFNYELTDNIGLKFNIGQNIQYSETNRTSIGGANLEIPGFYNITNVLNPANPSSLRNNRFVSKTTGTFINVDLNYSDYLFLNATMRREGNSVAKKGNQFYNYPSVGLSFVPTKVFDFLKGKNTLSNLKIYGNYTKVGSLDPIGAYQILNTGTLAANFPFPDTGNSYQDLTNITNADIKPETYTTIEAGVNFGFFKDRLTLDVAGYLTKTSDLITSTSASSFSGLGSAVDNNGELEAKGYEIDLGFMPVNTEKFKWNGRVSFSAYDTKVVDAGEGEQITLYGGGNSNVDGEIAAVEGYSFPYIVGTDWLRDNNGNVIVNSEGRPSVDARFKKLGQALPKYIVGLTNSFNYKGFGLSFTVDYRTGHSFISQTKHNLTWNGHLFESGEFDRNLGFLFPGSVIDNPATATVGDYIPNTSVLTGGFYTLTGNNNRTQAYYGQAANLGSHNLIDATSLKVREIAFSYNMPSKLISKTGLTSLKFSVNARNPFVFLADGKFIKAKNGMENRGYADPEASSQFNSSTTNAAQNPGGTVSNASRNGVGIIGDGQYPSTRTFGFAINATF